MSPFRSGIISRMLIRTIALCILALMMIGCSTDTTVSTGSATFTTAPVLEATPTQRPMALLVNGEAVWLEEYQAGMQQIQHAQTELGLSFSEEEASNMVLEDLIHTTILAQEAKKNGYLADEADLNSRITELADALGGSDAFATWLTRNGYTQEVFFHAFQKAEAAGWQIGRITSAVSLTAEQVHARQILFTNREDIEEAFFQLENGYDFPSLASFYDPLTGGDLGWFPRGYLLQPSVEEAAFDLEIGSYSSIIETTSGFHIVFVIARETERPLSQDALLTLQDKAIKEWMDDTVLSSTIEIFVP